MESCKCISRIAATLCAAGSLTAVVVVSHANEYEPQTSSTATATAPDSPNDATDSTSAEGSPPTQLPGFIAQLGTSTFRASGPLESIAFSPDNRYLIGGGRDSSLWVWSVKTGQIVKHLSIRFGDLARIHFTPDQTEIHAYSGLNTSIPIRHRWTYPEFKPLAEERLTPAAAQMAITEDAVPHRKVIHGPRGSLIIRDANTGELLLSIEASVDRKGARLSPDESILLVALDNREQTEHHLQAWNLTDHRKVQDWTTEASVGEDFYVTADNKYVVAAELHRDIDIWDLETGKQTSKPKNNLLPGAHLAVVAGGKRLLVLRGNNIDVVEIPTGKLHCSVDAREVVRQYVASPDGKLLATCGNSAQASLFNLDTGKEVFAKDGHQSEIADLRFSRNGDRLFSLDSSQKLIEWNVATHKPLQTVSLPESIRRIICAPNGDLIVAGLMDAAPFLWEVGGKAEQLDAYRTKQRETAVASAPNGILLVAGPNGALYLCDAFAEFPAKSYPRDKFRGQTGDILGLAVSDDGKIAGSIDDEHELRIWKTGSTEAARRINLAGNPLKCLAVSSDGSEVAAVVSHQLTVWNTKGSDPAVQVKLDDDDPTALRFAADGQSILLGTKGGRLRVCGLAVQTITRDVAAHTGPIGDIQLSRDGLILYSAGRDGMVASWRPADLEKIAVIDKGLAPIMCLSLIANGKLLAAGDESGKFVVWETATHRRLREMQEPLGVRQIVASADGADMAMLEGFDSLVRMQRISRPVFEAKPAQPATAVGQSAPRQTTATLPRMELQPMKFSTALFAQLLHGDRSVAISPDGRQVARTTPAGVRVWRINGGSEDGNEPLKLPTGKDYGEGAAFSHAGKLLAIAGDGFSVWNLETRKPVLEVPQVGEYRCGECAFSPDDRFLVALAERQDSLRIWNIETGNPASEIRIPDPYLLYISQVHFSSDSRLLFTLDNHFHSEQPAINVWEVATGKLLGDVLLPRQPINSIAISDDGKRLAVGLPSGLIWLCDLPPMMKSVYSPTDDVKSDSLDELWDRLGSPDPSDAYAAMATMCRQPVKTLKFIRDELHQMPEASNKSVGIDQLVERLASDDISIRTAASTELRKLGVAAYPALNKGLDQQIAEPAKARIELLLNARVRPPEPAILCGIRCVQIIERIQGQGAAENRDARELLTRLTADSVAPAIRSEAQAALGRLPGGVRQR